MTRALTVPFALPQRRASHPSSLGMPHFVVLLAGVLLVPLVIQFLIYPSGVDAFERHEVLAYRGQFGFDVGDVPTGEGDAYWGFTRVTPGGLADRGGIRAGDVIATHHGTPGGYLHGALRNAAAGREGCLEVHNMPVRRAGRLLDRTVCLGSPRPAELVEPTCPLPSPSGMCPAPTGGAVLVWQEPANDNGRHALILRSPSGAPDVLVRAFDRFVQVLWSPDGRAVAIRDHDGSGESAVWVHWGPLLSHQANLAESIAATGLRLTDGRNVVAQGWDDASTLRVAVQRSYDPASAPTFRFRYLLGGAVSPLP
jgi:hypothetical protein